MPRRPGDDLVDVPLFKLDELVHTVRDTRTVGEMLADVDHLARELLLDVEGSDAASLVRGWPDLVDSASSFWSALPGRRPDHDARDVPIERLPAQAQTIAGRLQPRRQWPPTGSGDPRLEQMSRNFRVAAELIDRYGSEIPTHRNDVSKDLNAARTRAMHGLYVTAHAIGVALRLEGSERTHHEGVPRREWSYRFVAAEGIAHSFL